MIVVGILVPDVSAGSSARPGAVSVAEIARRAAAMGARTEVVGVAPAGPGGDRHLLVLAAAGVGHATVIRSAADGVESADLDLALRYLPDVRAIVLVRPTGALLRTGLAAATWSGAAPIVIGPLEPAATALLDPGSDAPAAEAGLAPSAPIMLHPPSRDPDGAFAGVVAALAVRLDAGEDPASAWRSTVSELAIDPA